MPIFIHLNPTLVEDLYRIQDNKSSDIKYVNKSDLMALLDNWNQLGYIESVDKAMINLEDQQVTTVCIGPRENDFITIITKMSRDQVLEHYYLNNRESFDLKLNEEYLFIIHWAVGLLNGKVLELQDSDELLAQIVDGKTIQLHPSAVASLQERIHNIIKEHNIKEAIAYRYMSSGILRKKDENNT